MAKLTKMAKLANRAKEPVKVVLVGHEHRCNDCGDYYRHDDDSCSFKGMAYRHCNSCSIVLFDFWANLADEITWADAQKIAYWSEVALQIVEVLNQKHEVEFEGTASD